MVQRVCILGWLPLLEIFPDNMLAVSIMLVVVEVVVVVVEVLEVVLDVVVGSSVVVGASVVFFFFAFPFLPPGLFPYI